MSREQRPPPGWVGSGLPLPEVINDCDYCGGTGKNYRSCWDLADAMAPDDCPVCEGVPATPKTRRLTP